MFLRLDIGRVNIVQSTGNDMGGNDNVGLLCLEVLKTLTKSLFWIACLRPEI